MHKEKLSRPLDWAVTTILAIIIGMVANLLVPYPQTASYWATVMLSSIRYYVMTGAFLILLSRHLHFRPAKLFSSHRFSIRKTMAFLLIWMALLAAFSLIKYLIHPESYYFNNFHKFFSPMLVSVLLFTPIQTFSEELFFRCTLAHLLHDEIPSGKKQIIAYSLASGVLFSVAHIGTLLTMNIAQSIQAAAFFLILGAFLMYLSLRTGGFEPAIAIHMANNLFLDLVVCQKDSSVLKNPAVLYSGSESFLLITELLFCIFGTLLIFYIVEKRTQTAIRPKESE